MVVEAETEEEEYQGDEDEEADGDGCADYTADDGRESLLPRRFIVCVVAHVRHDCGAEEVVAQADGTPIRDFAQGEAPHACDEVAPAHV